MKKQLLKPGFEFIFTLSILAILGLPPLVFGQNKKDMDININNGDTTINGKNIKELSAKDRQDALKDINNISGTLNVDIKKDGGQKEVVIRRRHKNGDADVNIIEKSKAGDEPMIVEDDGHGPDVKVMKLRIKGGKGDTATYTYNYRINGEPNDDGDPHRMEVRTLRINGVNGEPDGDGGPHRMEVRGFRMNRMGDGRMMDFDRKNTQNFVYSNTDNNGISTHVSFHVSDNHEMLDEAANKEKQLGMLDVQDLNLVPEFAAGKTVLMFSLPSKAVAEVQLKDSKGNLLWSEKALNGSFSKSFSLGLNGIYYLQVKQAGKIAVKRIAKEE